MKLTKKQLKTLIKEELGSIQMTPFDMTMERVYDLAVNVDSLVNQAGTSLEELKQAWDETEHKLHRKAKERGLDQSFDSEAIEKLNDIEKTIGKIRKVYIVLKQAREDLKHFI